MTFLADRQIPSPVTEGLPEEKSGGVSLCAMLYALCVLNISDTLPILLLG